jgi:hypothetical protein
MEKFLPQAPPFSQIHPGLPYRPSGSIDLLLEPGSINLLFVIL